jgi:hypothetical protein
MRGKHCGMVLALTALVVFSGVNSASAQRRRGGNGAAQQKARMVAAAQQQLAMARQVLAQAEMEANDAQSVINPAQERIEGARKSISDAKSGALESSKTQKSIEAEILGAQSETSDYAKANIAFLEAQDEVKTTTEDALSNDEYLAKKAAISKEDGYAANMTKLRAETLQNDMAYQKAFDKLKASRVVLNRIKMDLFKGSTEWEAAVAANKEHAADETKANQEATKGAFKKMPAVRKLREANAVADEARASIAQAEMMLKSLGAKPATYAGTTTTGGNSQSGK